MAGALPEHDEESPVYRERGNGPFAGAAKHLHLGAMTGAEAHTV